MISENSSPAYFQQLSTELSLPIVVRPDFPLRGKLAVQLCNSHKLFKNAVSQACQHSANGCADISQFIAGNDVSMLVHVQHGSVHPIACWDELNIFALPSQMSHPSNANIPLQAIGLAVPSRQGNQMIRAMTTQIRRFAEGFAQLDYVLAFSFRVDLKNQAWLIEVHADLTGDLILDRLLPIAAKKEIFPDLVSGLLGGNYPHLDEQSLTPTALLFSSKPEKSEKISILQAESLTALYKKITVFQQRRTEGHSESQQE